MAYVIKDTVSIGSPEGQDTLHLWNEAREKHCRLAVEQDLTIAWGPDRVITLGLGWVNGTWDRSMTNRWASSLSEEL